VLFCPLSSGLSSGDRVRNEITGRFRSLPSLRLTLIQSVHVRNIECVDQQRAKCNEGSGESQQTWPCYVLGKLSSHRRPFFFCVSPPSYSPSKPRAQSLSLFLSPQHHPRGEALLLSDWHRSSFSAPEFIYTLTTLVDARL